MIATHVGLDAHKKATVAFVVHADGKREGPFTMQTTKEGLTRFAKKVKGGKMMVEASTTGKAVVKHLRAHNVDAVLVHPDALMLALRRHKNDEADALHLANVARLGAAIEAYVPTEYEEKLRSISRRRRDVVCRMTALKCEAHAVLARNLVKPPAGKLPRESAIRRWERVPGLADYDRLVLQTLLREIQFLAKEEESLRLQLYAATEGDAAIKRMLTIPGVDIVNATTFRGEFGDLRRFKTAKHAASYAGIVPPNRQSGDKEMHGHITKKGSPYLRHALVEAAHQLCRFPGAMKTRYTRLSKRIGRSKALVATGRKLAMLVWRLVVKEEDYNDQDEKLTEIKLWKHAAVIKLLDRADRDQAMQILDCHDLRRHRARGRWSV